jgi:hypothetical protein
VRQGMKILFNGSTVQGQKKQCKPENCDSFASGTLGTSFLTLNF